MLPGADHVLNTRARVTRGHERLADQNGVRAPLRVFKDVVGLGDTRFRDRNDVLRNDVDDLLDGLAVNLEGLQVTCVDTDDRCTGFKGTQCLQARMRLDERLHTKRTRAL